MKRKIAMDFLKSLGCKVPTVQPRAQWIISDCPFGPWRHTEGKSAPHVFGVRTSDQGDAFCNCFSCGWAGSMSELLIDMKLHNKMEPHTTYDWSQPAQLIADAEADFDLDLDGPGIESLLEPHKGMIEFPGWWLETFGKPGDFEWAVKYLQSRKVGPKMAELMDLHVDAKQRRICFPVRDFEGRLVGLHGRAIESGVDPRYRMYTYAHANNPMAWLGESWVDTTKPIVTVEGPFDIASVRRLYRNTVSPLFASVSQEKLKRMKVCLEWYTLFDHGKAGDTARNRVDSACSDILVKHLYPPAGRDPGNAELWQLAEILGEHLELDDLID